MNPPLTKEEKTVNAGVVERLKRRQRAHQYGQFEISPLPQLTEMPTPEQIAHLAATMAPKLQGEDYNKVCANALRLWASAVDALALQTLRNQDHAADIAAAKAERESVPPAHKFPMKLDGFLKIILPKEDTGDRAAIFKGWLRSILSVEHYHATTEAGYVPTQSEVIARYTASAKEEIREPLFRHWKSSVLEWHEKNKRASTSKARSEAGKLGAKVKKKKGKKRLEA